jgi:hypothetical protein
MEGLMNDELEEYSSDVSDEGRHMDEHMIAKGTTPTPPAVTGLATAATATTQYHQLRKRNCNQKLLIIVALNVIQSC